VTVLESIDASNGNEDSSLKIKDKGFKIKNRTGVTGPRTKDSRQRRSVAWYSVGRFSCTMVTSITPSRRSPFLLS